MRKQFAYIVVESTCPKVKVGAVLLYARSRGPTHSEAVFNTKTYEFSSSFAMELIGPCWVVDGKVQFEKPPQPSGVYTKGIMKAARDRGRELRLILSRDTP